MAPGGWPTAAGQSALRQAQYSSLSMSAGESSQVAGRLMHCVATCVALLTPPISSDSTCVTCSLCHLHGTSFWSCMHEYTWEVAYTYTQPCSLHAHLSHSALALYSVPMAVSWQCLQLQTSPGSSCHCYLQAKTHASLLCCYLEL